MDKQLFLERLEILKELGFTDVPDCEPSAAFKTYVVALDTNIIVRGDHADDIAYIYYSCVEVDGEVLDGFFFAPSILEHPFLNYQTYDVKALLEEIDKDMYTGAKYVFVGGYPMIFMEVSEYDWKSKDLRILLSDMLKIIGVTDYFFSREFNRQLALLNNK